MEGRGRGPGKEALGHSALDGALGPVGADVQEGRAAGTIVSGVPAAAGGRTTPGRTATATTGTTAAGVSAVLLGLDFDDHIGFQALRVGNAIGQEQGALKGIVPCRVAVILVAGPVNGQVHLLVVAQRDFHCLRQLQGILCRSIGHAPLLQQSNACHVHRHNGSVPKENTVAGKLPGEEAVVCLILPGGNRIRQEVLSLEVIAGRFLDVILGVAVQHHCKGIGSQLRSGLGFDEALVRLDIRAILPARGLAALGLALAGVASHVRVAELVRVLVIIAVI